jgi:hypothetical protein
VLHLGEGITERQGVTYLAIYLLILYISHSTILLGLGKSKKSDKEMTDNLHFVKDLGYQTYDNFDAIEVPFTDSIPSDYEGVMGVPISFLNKYNPDQFEIVALSRYQGTGMKKEFVEAYFASGQTGQISEGHPDLCYYDNNGKPVVPYRRILIRHRKTAQ